MGRRLAVRVAAWGLSRGLLSGEVAGLLRRAFPWRDEDWRAAVLEDARARVGRP